MRILDERREALVDQERALLERFIEFLKGFGAPSEDAELVRRALSYLEELFLLVIVGEFNSGKSAFINALLGAEVSEEGVTPTTSRITVLRHSPEPTQRERRDGVLEKGYPNAFLHEIAIVDTPGTNAIIRHHEALSRGFVPRSDLVLFVTSAGRPLTESERDYLELIRDWGKKILLVINKADLLADEEKREEVRTFVDGGIRSALGLTPPIFFVSSLIARKAKTATNVMERDALIRASGFAELEAYVTDLLDEEGRVRLKMESPLGVVEQLNRRYKGAVDERLALLEENIRFANIPELFRQEKISERFEREVVADTEELVDERVNELVDWMVDRNLKQWRTVVDYVNRRRQADYDERLIGEVGDAFEYNRGQVRRSVGKNAQDVVQRYDRERESEKLALSLQGAVTQTAALEVGAVGIGAVVVALATTRFLDATGIIAAAIVAGYGLFILPNRRRKARDDFREKTDALRERLGEVVRRQFEAELGRSVERMREAIAPYTRFVRSEHARMSSAREDLAALDAKTSALKDEISAPGVGPRT